MHACQEVPPYKLVRAEHLLGAQRSLIRRLRLAGRPVGQLPQACRLIVTPGLQGRSSLHAHSGALFGHCASPYWDFMRPASMCWMRLAKQEQKLLYEPANQFH